MVRPGAPLCTTSFGGIRMRAPWCLRQGALTFAAALVLAACGTAPPPQTAAPASPLPVVVATAPSTVPAPPPIDDAPARLIGMDATSLTDLLGEPVRVRRDASVEIRQYRGETACQVDAFLYPDGSVRRVSHVEIRDGIARLAPEAARACLRGLIAARRVS
jgi:hypothetical protein